MVEKDWKLNIFFKQLVPLRNKTKGQTMQTNYDEIIPQGILFNLKQVQEMNIIKVDMAKKLISKGELEFVKIGNKLHLSRAVLIRYLEDNTIEAVS